MKANRSMSGGSRSVVAERCPERTRRSASLHITLHALTLYAVTFCAHAQVPQIINYQGRISVGGTNFTGTGQFKFALVNATGTTTYWSNDGNSPPTGTVSVPVAQGLYSVLLGDGGMIPIPGTVFTNTDVRLRVWFNSGSGLQQLSPDQRVATVGYALIAGSTDPTVDVLGRRLNIGINHTLTGDLATIAGGTNNTASAGNATVSGGSENTASQDGATVAGGWINKALGNQATVGGGRGNEASGSWGTVGGGFNNIAWGSSSVVGGGSNNGASNQWSVVSGGYHNTANGEASTIGGGINNLADGAYATVAGGDFNFATNLWATVAGGQDNRAYGNTSSIGGGLNNTADGAKATVGGGDHNAATNDYATVPGGSFCVAGGKYGFAAGRNAKAVHDGSFVWADSGGVDFASTTNDQFCVRAGGGLYIRGPLLDLDYGDLLVQGPGSSDSAGEAGTVYLGTVHHYIKGEYGFGVKIGTYAVGDAIFVKELTGNVGIGTNAPVSKLHVNGTVTATAFNPPSDRNLKEHFVAVNGREVLERLASVPISRWNFKQAPDVPHIGPVAQDFHAAFGVGTDDKHIATVDADGVALAAIQGLYEVVQEKDARIAKLEKRLAELENQMRLVSQQLERSRAAPQPAVHVRTKGGI